MFVNHNNALTITFTKERNTKLEWIRWLRWVHKKSGTWSDVLSEILFDPFGVEISNRVAKLSQCILFCTVVVVYLAPSKDHCRGLKNWSRTLYAHLDEWNSVLAPHSGKCAVLNRITRHVELCDAEASRLDSLWQWVEFWWVVFVFKQRWKISSFFL